MLQQEDRVLKNGVSIAPKLECAPQACFGFIGCYRSAFNTFGLLDIKQKGGSK
jgi:hypothetical protein